MIELDINGRTGQITFSRPTEGNAFTGAMALQFQQALNQAAGKADVLILSGEGTDFTIGRDRNEPKAGSPYDAFSKVSAVNKAMAAFPGIIIAAVQGRAFGLGVGLTMRSDIAIASADARFKLDEVSHGIPPMFIMEAIVDHLAPKRALDIVLSGMEFGAEEALDMGLLSRLVPAGSFKSAVANLVAELASRDPSVVLACKRYIHQVAALPREARSAFALVEQAQFVTSNSLQRNEQ